MLNEYSRRNNAFSKGDKQLSFHIMDVMDLRHCIRCSLSNHFINIVMEKPTRERKAKSLSKSQNYIAFADFWEGRSKKKKPQTNHYQKTHTNIIVSTSLFLTRERERRGERGGTRKLHLCLSTSTALSASTKTSVLQNL